MVCIKLMIPDDRQYIRQEIFIRTGVNQIHLMESGRKLQLMVVHMLTVSGKPGNYNSFLTPFYGINDRTGAAVRNEDRTCLEHFRKLGPVIEGLIPAMGRQIITGACLDTDLFRDGMVPDHPVYLFKQAVKWKLLGTDGYKYHRITSIDTSEIHGAGVEFQQLRPLDIEAVREPIEEFSCPGRTVNICIGFDKHKLGTP